MLPKTFFELIFHDKCQHGLANLLYPRRVAIIYFTHFLCIKPHSWSKCVFEPYFDDLVNVQGYEDDWIKFSPKQNEKLPPVMTQP